MSIDQEIIAWARETGAAFAVRGDSDGAKLLRLAELAEKGAAGERRANSSDPTAQTRLRFVVTEFSYHPSDHHLRGRHPPEEKTTLTCRADGWIEPSRMPTEVVDARAYDELRAELKALRGGGTK